MKSLRIIIVDDSWLVRHSASMLLATFPGAEIVGQAASAEEALPMIEHLAPNLVLMDITMPGMSGIEAIKLIKALPNPPRVIMFTVHDGPNYRAAAKAAGADGFIAKDQFIELAGPLIIDFDRNRPPTK
jgi:DNA-binding NarL/FixJ family response regulator